MKRGLPLISLFTLLSIVYLFLHWKYGIINLPFFWDELGVYSRAAMHQAVHGLSIMPSSMPDVLSRGHPLLTPFVFGSSFKLFGVSLATARITGIMIYFIGVLFSYLTLIKFIKPWWAMVFLLCIAVQPAFLAQSMLVLPETLLLSCTLVAIYYFTNNNFWGMTLALCISILIKESALVLPIAFAIAYFYKTSLKVKSLLVFTLPVCGFLLFLLIQKIQNGYFLYPLHQGLMDFNLVPIFSKITSNLYFLFIDQGRWVLIAGLSILFIIKFKWNTSKNTTLSPTFILICLIIIGGISFSSINYYLDRYTLYFLFPMLMISFIWLSKQSIYAKYGIVAFSLFAAFYNLNNDKRFVDTDFAYVQHVRSLESGFKFAKLLPVKSKLGYNWPMVMANWSSNSGYALPNAIINEVNADNIYQFDYIFISHPGQTVLNRDISNQITLLKEIKRGYATVSVYKIKNKIPED